MTAEGFKLLQSSDDWEAHRKQIVYDDAYFAKSVSQGEHIHWGNPPARYPCLVASLRTGNDRVASCFVYETDAIRLLAKTTSVSSPRQKPETTESLKEPRCDNSSGIAYKQETAVLASNITKLTTLVTTILQELYDVKLTTKPRFEELLAKRLKAVEGLSVNDLVEWPAE